MKWAGVEFVTTTETGGMIVNRPRRRQESNKILSQIVSAIKSFSFFRHKAAGKTHVMSFAEWQARENRREWKEIAIESLAFLFIMACIIYGIPLLLLGVL